MQLSLVPLSKDSILLPGVTLRIPLNDRPDIPLLLSAAFNKTTPRRTDSSSIIIGCVPLASPYLSKDGRNLIDIDGSSAPVHPKSDNDIRPAKAAADDLFGYGTIAKIVGVQGRPDAEPYLLVEGLRRFKIDQITQERPFFQGEVTTHTEDVNLNDTEIADLFAKLKLASRELLTLLRLSSLFPSAANTLNPLTARRFESFISRKDLTQAGLMADFMAHVANADREAKLRILATPDAKQRLEMVLEILGKQLGDIKGNMKITSFSTTLPNSPSSDPLRRQPNLMNRRLPFGGFAPGAGGPNGGADDDKEANEVDELKQKLDEAGLSPEAQKVAERELKRLRKMNPANAEYGVCRSYLENLAEIPWSKSTDDQLNAETLKKARKQLDDDHYGLEKIKKRLLEYLAVLKLKQAVNADLDTQIEKLTTDAQASESKANSESVSDAETDAAIANLQILKSRRAVDKSPILLLVGPPGTGKTSLAKSVATSLGRKFHRISLGGVRDEAEIRGHRRTYVAAMPGLIVSGLKKVGVTNPVFLLDEIDKIGGSNFHGDPSAAMLEVLDPEQNNSFMDHYINIPIDLSKVVFIATANSLDTIPPPLLDRMETIQLSGYTTLEKRHIAKRHLIPKQIRTNGLVEGHVAINDEVLDKVIASYTRESGVRNLERELGSVCRYKAVQYSDSQDSSNTYDPAVSIDDLEDILGIERFDEEIAEKHSRPGIVTGLVAYSTGGQGSILFIEIADMPGSGRVQLTGKLGDVLKESVEVALTWVKAHSYELGLTHDPSHDIMKNRSIHVHCPSGAIPKDGPSAGLAHTIALISLFSGKAVPPQIAMTGEISLRGRVMPVGGIKEKLIGALRAGVKTVLLPVQNRKDVKDVPIEVKEGLDIIYVNHIWEAMRHVWPEAHWPGEDSFASVQSRL